MKPPDNKTDECMYLGQLVFQDVISQLCCVQLSVEAGTNHGHDVIDTPHSVLLGQQVPAQSFSLQSTPINTVHLITYNLALQLNKTLHNPSLYPDITKQACININQYNLSKKVTTDSMRFLRSAE